MRRRAVPRTARTKRWRQRVWRARAVRQRPNLLQQPVRQHPGQYGLLQLALCAVPACQNCQSGNCVDANQGQTCTTLEVRQNWCHSAAVTAPVPTRCALRVSSLVTHVSSLKTATPSTAVESRSSVKLARVLALSASAISRTRAVWQRLGLYPQCCTKACICGTCREPSEAPRRRASFSRSRGTFLHKNRSAGKGREKVSACLLCGHVLILRRFALLAASISRKRLTNRCFFKLHRPGTRVEEFPVHAMELTLCFYPQLRRT